MQADVPPATGVPGFWVEQQVGGGSQSLFLPLPYKRQIDYEEGLEQGVQLGLVRLGCIQSRFG